MSWRDRDYNQGRESINEFFANPGSIFAFSIPFGTWFGARIRLHFWLLLSILFLYIGAIQAGNLLFTTAVVALLIASLILHEFGHRIAARWVGGSHDEFMLWPAGGMIPPNAPLRPLPTFIAHSGGIAMNLLVAMISGLAIFGLHRMTTVTLLHPIAGVQVALASSPQQLISFLQQCLGLFYLININLVIFNLIMIFYWFDGAYILQAILWPWTGLYQAVNVTCIIGMIEATILFILALRSTNFLNLIYAALLFSSSFVKRRELKAAGPEELQEAMAVSSAYDDRPMPRKKLRKSWFKQARQRALREQAEQAKIDAILDKVHDHGLHSLTWFEKRTLKKATERQRQQDLAERL